MKMSRWISLEAKKKLKKKKKSGQDESMPMGSGSALFRADAKAFESESGGMHESVRLVEAYAENEELSPAEGPKVKVVLLTEGLGNIHDKNYYGPEAVNSMPNTFEGAVCMLNHLSNFDEQNRPEGDVQNTVGYFKNLRVETLESGKLGCVGELHFDLTDEGRNAYKRAETAIHYREEFPNLEREYVGLSVNASGDSEPREMMVNGEMIEVNYVLKFLEARSCDMVTLPARGGKFVALVESIAGAQMKNKEVRTMIVKRLRAAEAALKEATSEKDPDLRGKKISEAQREIQSLLKEAVEAASRSNKGKKSLEGKKEDEDEDESESDKGAGDMEDETEAEDGVDGDAEKSGDSHTVTTHKVVKKTGKAAVGNEDEDESKESHRFAVKALISESGLSAEFFEVSDLMTLSFKEAKAKISETKRIHEATAKKILESIDVEASHGGKALESSRGGSKSNDDAFPDLII